MVYHRNRRTFGVGITALSDSVSAIVEPCKDGSDNWYWCVEVDDGIYAEGEAASAEEAARKAEANYNEWLAKQ